MVVLTSAPSSAKAASLFQPPPASGSMVKWMAPPLPEDPLFHSPAKPPARSVSAANMMAARSNKRRRRDRMGQLSQDCGVLWERASQDCVRFANPFPPRSCETTHKFLEYYLTY